MRLHTLDLTAIGPYAAAQRIDFGTLAASGLFLLEGPTGAGKTTILDAITFALYGGLSGDAETSAGDRLHSHFAGPDAEPSVTLEFSVRGVRYRIRRSPEYQRRKRRGDGFTLQAAQVHLERGDGGGWTSLSSNKAEAGEVMAEIIGLNRAQFTQVMLLPQGEFAKFLRSDDDGRRVLLTRLFHVGQYDRITAELESGAKAAAARRRAAGERIDAATAAAAEAAGLDALERDELLALTRPDRATRLKEIGAELARTIEVTRAAWDLAAGRLTTARHAAERAQRQSALMSRLTAALAELREHEATRPGHDDRAARLAAGRQAEPVRPLLAALDTAEAAVQDARAALARLRGPASVDRPASDAAEDDAGEVLARAEGAEQLAASLQHLADAEGRLAALSAALDDLRESSDDAADRVTALEAARLELPGRIATAAAQLDEARLAAAGLAVAQDQLAVLEARLAAATQAADLAAELAVLDEAARAAVDEHQQFVDAHQRALEERLENMAAELAEQLAAGAACPVCGSPDHPGPAAHQAGAVSAHDVDDAAGRRDRAAEARLQAEAQRDAAAAAAATAAAAAGGATPGELTAALAEVAEQVAAAAGAAEEAAALEPELADLAAERDRLGDDLQAAAAAAATARQQMVDRATELGRLTAELSAAAGAHESVTARRATLRQSAAADRALAGALSSLAARRADAAAAGLRAEQELAAGPFATLDAARSAVLAPAQQAALAQHVDAWLAEQAGRTAAATASDLASLDAGRAEEIHLAAELAADKLADATDAEREVRDAVQTHSAQEERLGQRAAELAQAEESADQLDEETEPAIRLDRLARGMEGHRRVALTTYVLRRWFEQVVQAANVRLAAMSAGRYELRRTDDPQARRQRAGLTLAVIDRHTGEERSPKSLSGGETFYTSLALALGLADVVRAEAGGVELDTLFIDEGFGSLDTQTLDQVMAVIDDLRDRGRAVGIVSHVADLKERVYERLEIRRLPDGSSTTKVVA